MARNLYDVGDRRPEGDGRWLNDKQENRARVVPMGMVLVALTLAGGCAALVMTIWPASDDAARTASAAMAINATFSLCDDRNGDACVLSADSYAWRGRVYHLADVSVPQDAGALCPEEAARARDGRAALAVMMNGGSFEARPDPADPDASARMLVRDGVSIGQLMILKGHARPWSRTPIDWCAT